MTAILGLSAFYHDSAAALIVDGHTVTLTDFASASAPEDARLIMLISARVVE